MISLMMGRKIDVAETLWCLPDNIKDKVIRVHNLLDSIELWMTGSIILGGFSGLFLTLIISSRLFADDEKVIHISAVGALFSFLIPLIVFAFFAWISLKITSSICRDKARQIYGLVGKKFTFKKIMKVIKRIDPDIIRNTRHYFSA